MKSLSLNFQNLKSLLLYGVVLGLASAGLSAVEYRFLILDHALELYSGIVAVSFTALGIWIGWKLTQPKSSSVSAVTTEFRINEKNLSKLNISQREMEVLELISHGLSNQEIADKLFVSINTIKTHSSNLFLKLDVKRRTSAVQKARTLGLIP